MVIHKHNHIECELFACGTYVHTDRHTDIHTYIHTYCTCMHAYIHMYIQQCIVLAYVVVVGWCVTSVYLL